MLGLGLRVSVGEKKSFHGDLDAMVRAGMEGLSEANPFALAWSQALPNIVNMVGGRVSSPALCRAWRPGVAGRGRCAVQVLCSLGGGLIERLL